VFSISALKLIAMIALGVGAVVILKGNGKPEQNTTQSIPDISPLQGFNEGLLSDFFAPEPNQTLASGIGSLGQGVNLPSAGSSLSPSDNTTTKKKTVDLTPAQSAGYDVNAYFRSMGLGEQVEVVGNIVQPKQSSGLSTSNLEKALKSNPSAVATTRSGGIIFNPIPMKAGLRERTGGFVHNVPLGNKKTNKSPIPHSIGITRIGGSAGGDVRRITANTLASMRRRGF